VGQLGRIIGTGPVSPTADCEARSVAMTFDQALERGRVRWSLTHPDDQAYASYRTSKSYDTAEIRQTLSTRQDNLCVYCEEKLPPSWHIDHLIPRSRPPRDLEKVSLNATTVNTLVNLAAACPDCNVKKSNIFDYEDSLVERVHTSIIPVPFGARGHIVGYYEDKQTLVMLVKELAIWHRDLADGFRRATVLSGLAACQPQSLLRVEFVEDSRRRGINSFECPMCGQTDQWIKGQTLCGSCGFEDFE
jgi:5-methylcytosine-specific restriction endonuclease McrA